MKIPVLKIRDENGNLIPINAIRGDKGKSAYEQAVEGGYNGTEEEFIAILNGMTISEAGGHFSDLNNPHKVTKEQVGLGNVENLAIEDQKPDFEEEGVDEIHTGETIRTLFGKIKSVIVDFFVHRDDERKHINHTDDGDAEIGGYTLLNPNGIIPNERLPIQIAYNSYLGAGKSGAENPNTLTFDFKPLFIRVTSPEHSGRYMVAMYPEAERRVENGYDDTTLHFAWTDNSVSWYSSSDSRPLSQFNGIDATYNYFVIGVVE